MATGLSGTKLTIETIQLKRGTETALADIVLAAAEKAVVIRNTDPNAAANANDNVGRTKTGDGTTEFANLPWDDALSLSNADFSDVADGRMTVNSSATDATKSASVAEVKELADDIESVKFDKADVSDEALYAADANNAALIDSITADANGDGDKTASLAKIKALARALLGMINEVDTTVEDGVLTAVSNAALGKTGTVTDGDKKAASVQDMVYAATRILALESVVTIDGGEVTAA